MEEEIRIINNIIEQAIYHGGDIGGPYYCNKNDLMIAIFELIKYKGLENQYDIVDDDMIQIIKR